MIDKVLLAYEGSDNAAARDELADMIMLGSRGLGSMSGAVLGSVSRKTLHHVAQAVLAAR
jgi:nucleotide-binding universal stress UspA family protein